MNSKNRRINLEELKLWKEVTKNDKKINEYIEEDKAEKINKGFFYKKENVLKNSKSTFSFSENMKKSHENEDLQINKSTLLKLKRGKINIEAKLDLHGYSQKNAKEAVKN